MRIIRDRDGSKPRVALLEGTDQLPPHLKPGTIVIMANPGERDVFLDPEELLVIHKKFVELTAVTPKE